MYPAPKTVTRIVANVVPYRRTLRSVVYRYGSSPAFARALREGDQELAAPPGEAVADGEWVLAMFEVGGKRRATASAARGITRAPGEPAALVFDRRDWERLVDFAEAGSVGVRVAAPAVELDRTSVWPAPQPPPEPPKKPADGKVRVLVVDDEREVCEIVGAMLEAVGLSVESMSSAEEALARVRAVGCDLLVLDWTLPGMTGLELCRLLRKDAAHASLPILFLSGRSSSQDVVEAFASGADDFVAKPFRAPELGARIFSLLRRARHSFAGT